LKAPPYWPYAPKGGRRSSMPLRCAMLRIVVEIISSIKVCTVSTTSTHETEPQKTTIFPPGDEQSRPRSPLERATNIFTILSSIATLISTLIFAVSVLTALKSLDLGAKNLSQIKTNNINDNFSVLFSRQADFNTRTEKDMCRRRAAEYWVGFGSDEKGPCVNEDDLYWGARSYILDVLNLLTQVWLLAGSQEESNGKQELKGIYGGWQSIAQTGAKKLLWGAQELDYGGWEDEKFKPSSSLKGKTPYANKPRWYLRACNDVWRYMLEQRRSYPPGFIDWMIQLSRN
jgi:hypothetical protein